MVKYLLILLAVVPILLLIQANRDTNEVYLENTTTTTTTTTTTPVRSRLPEYLAILKNISSSHRWTMYGMYGEDRFNCADFTALAVKELRKANYTAYPVCGWLGHTYHAWVRIEFDNDYRDFEPQSAKDVTNDPNYRFTRRCVVRGVY